MKANKMKIRRLIHSVDITASKQVAHIDLLLPGDVCSCMGLQTLIHGVFPTDRNFIPTFGEYALEFNGKSLHPVTGIVGWLNPQLLSDDNYFPPEIVLMDVSIEGNRLVTGFYRDLGEQETGFVPYQVKFIFHLQQK